MRSATPEIIREGINLLKKGQPVSFPTDTVYALGSPVNDATCAKKIYELKQRPLNQALPILLSDIRDIELVARDISDTARVLMKNFWPGALTLVFKKPRSYPICHRGETDGCSAHSRHPLATKLSGEQFFAVGQAPIFTADPALQQRRMYCHNWEIISN